MAELNSLEQTMLYGVIVVAFISLVYAAWLFCDTIRRDKGTKEMQRVWAAIKEGANAYLGTQLMTILPILVGLAVLLFFSVYVIQPTVEALKMFSNDVSAARLRSASVARLLSSWARPSRLSSGSWACAWPLKATSASRRKRSKSTTTRP